MIAGQPYWLYATTILFWFFLTWLLRNPPMAAVLALMAFGFFVF